MIENITEDEIDKISEKKDLLFITKIKETNNNILIDGVLDFFDKVQNSKIAIVTRCNRKSAEYILKFTQL